MFGPDPDPQGFADPDRAKTCGSGSETLLLDKDFVIADLTHS